MISSQPWLIVGLGNPGAAYSATRHNAGHMVIDVLARRVGGTLGAHKTNNQVLETRLGLLPSGAPGPRTILAVTNSYMNTSGGPVKALMQWANIDPDHLLVIHDELDLEPHTLRLKFGGGEGGHNGLRSISSALGTRNYARLRVGIGRPPGQQDVADFVLKPFVSSDLADLGVTLELAADAVEDVVLSGLERAQLKLHTKK